MPIILAIETSSELASCALLNSAAGADAPVLTRESSGVRTHSQSVLPMVQDLLGGQIELGTPAFGPSTMATKVLAVAADQRLDVAPDVPTLKESGIDLTCSTWNAIFAPRGTPKPIIARLNAAIAAYLEKPETKKAFSGIGLTPWGGSPERVTAQMADDRKTWGDIVKRLQPANPKQ